MRFKFGLNLEKFEFKLELEFQLRQKLEQIQRNLEQIRRNRWVHADWTIDSSSMMNFIECHKWFIHQ
jgi:hypothetical protein